MSVIEEAMGLPPSGTVRVRFTGNGPTYHPEYGEIKPGVFDCPAALAGKLLEAGKKTGDYVPVDEYVTDAESAAALSADASTWRERPDHKAKAKEKE